MKKILLLLPLLFINVSCGYITPSVGIMDVVNEWRNGINTKYYDYSQKAVYRSIKSTLKQMDIEILKDEYILDHHYISAGNGDRFRIYIYAKSPKVTQVKIRINIMGDAEYANLIFDSIESNMDTISF